MWKSTVEQSVIMVVDDREDDLLLIRRAFQRARVLNPIVCLSSGDEAIEYLQGHGTYANRDEYPLPDLILLDLKMPKTDGFEVLQWIRSQRTLSSIRVVVLTSSDQIKDVNRAYELGANSFITKPIMPEQFTEVANALSGYWLWTCRSPESHRAPTTKSVNREDK
jgi:CheY-like chemotaxis protein